MTARSNVMGFPGSGQINLLGCIYLRDKTCPRDPDIMFSTNMILKYVKGLILRLLNFRSTPY